VKYSSCEGMVKGNGHPLTRIIMVKYGKNWVI